MQRICSAAQYFAAGNFTIESYRFIWTIWATCTARQTIPSAKNHMRRRMFGNYLKRIIDFHWKFDVVYSNNLIIFGLHVISMHGKWCAMSKTMQNANNTVRLRTLCSSLYITKHLIAPLKMMSDKTSLRVMLLCLCTAYAVLFIRAREGEGRVLPVGWNFPKKSLSKWKFISYEKWRNVTNSIFVFFPFLAWIGSSRSDRKRGHSNAPVWATDKPRRHV